MTPELEKWLLQNDYYQLKVLPDGRICGLLRMLFTEALVINMDWSGYEYRYCYEPDTLASSELEKYDGTTEPTGWIVKK